MISDQRDEIGIKKFFSDTLFTKLTTSPLLTELTSNHFKLSFSRASFKGENQISALLCTSVGLG